MRLRSPGVTLVVFAIMAGLYSVDVFLARLEQREVGAEGRRRYAAGQQLIAQEQFGQAAEMLTQAHALERSNRNYSVALASALLAGGRTEGARSTLTEILQRDSNYAPANLWMARVEASDQHFREADSYYHRAIYGAWPANEPQERLKARLEVAGVLAAHGGNYELLSELLVLQNTAGSDPGVLKKVAQFYLQAGVPDRAADVYRSVLRHSPRDTEANAGLVKAELENGDYHAAHLAAVKAFLHAPNDLQLRHQMDLAGKLMSLDPTPRYLSATEKVRRATEILNLVRTEIAGCSAGKTPAPVERTPKSAAGEQAEENIALAEQLWETRRLVCASRIDPDDPLTLLFKKVRQ